MKSPSIRDVAARAGCSIAAVSKVVNGAKGSTIIGPALAQRIQAAARQLGYQPNVSAQLLRANRALGIGVLIPSAQNNHSLLSGTFHSSLISGMEMATEAAGQNLIVIGEPPGPAFGTRALATLAQRRIHGLVLIPGSDPSFPRRMLAATGPVAWASCHTPRRQPRVFIDPAPGLEAALGHLAGLGHRRFLLLGAASSERGVIEARTACCASWLRRHRLTHDSLHISAAEISAQASMAAAAHQSVAAYLHRKGRATAFVCLTELLAIGAYYALYAAGRPIPAAASVVAFDNIRPHVFDPLLSSVSHELPEIGRRSAEIVIAQASDPAFRPPRTVAVASRFIPRASTGPAPA
jgi:LacI family transcriptional regulator